MRPSLAWTLGVVLWCCGWPLVARADARVEARRHFKSGMASLSAGRFDEGIDELKQAYAIRPHPHVLFNIGKAYQSAGRPKDAIHYFQRYLSFDPDDADKVLKLVRDLEAVAPPEPPKVEPPRGEPSRPGSQAVAPEELVRRLESLTERLTGALARAEKQPPPTRPALAAVEGSGLRVATGEEASSMPYEETVVTASRRSQSTLESPNATTIITGEEIRLSGARSLPELLRRVPGAEVMTMGVGSANVSFRGFNQRSANKVLVLIDGRPEYQDFLGITMWSSFPIGLEEIERIEVVRGPGSAMYGANAMAGVVNIITRTPGTQPRAEFDALGGSGNIGGGSFVASGGESTLKYRASVGYQQEDKWTRDYADDRPDVAPNVSDTHIGLRVARANLVTRWSPSRDVSLGLSGGVAQIGTEFYPLGLLRNFWFDGTASHVKADANMGPLRLRLFWNHLDGAAMPQYSPVGQRSMTVHIDSNLFDGELLFGQELSLLGVHRLDAGVSTRLKRVSYEYINGLREELHAAAFLQDEWRIVDPLRLVASYRVDRHPLLDGGRPGYAQSPRISALWSPFEGHALRLTFATAFREPTYLESYTDIRTPVPGVAGASVVTNGDTALRAEGLVGFELGWRGELARWGLDYELAAYQNTVTDLTGLTAVKPLPPEQAWDERTGTYLLGRSVFYNDPARYTARGLELGLKVTPVDGLDLRLSGAVQQVTSTGTGACGPCTQAPAYKAYGGATYRSKVNLDLSFDAAYTAATVWVEREPSPTDPTQISALENPLPGYAVINARLAYRFLKDRLTFGVVGTQLGPAHAEHPFGNRIERRFLATLSVTP